ncbi:MAG TPA: hypothetical protein VHO67_13950 [Polyangia bacterium]|nr:hypothetical protein [Polyangia bacterium]
MRSSVLLILVTISISLASTGPARAEGGTVDVTAPESVVHTAPFDVAPQLGRVHAGDKLSGERDVQDGWLRVRLPDGRQGFLHTGDARVTAPPAVQAPAVASAETAPVAPAAPTRAAEGPPVISPAASAPSRSSGPVTLGIAFSLLPAATLTTSTPTTTTNADADVTGAVAPFLDVPLTRWFAVGASPQFVLKVKTPGASQSWTEYDLRARLTLLDPFAVDRRLFVRVSPGYSTLSPPSGTWSSGVSDPAGFVVDFSVGGETAFGPDATLMFDIGYQVGFQGTFVNGYDVDARTRFLHVGFGFALGL